MKTFVIAIIIITSNSIFGQLINQYDDTKNQVAEYPGGMAAIQKILQDSIKYPQDSILLPKDSTSILKAKIEKVIVSFVVDINGKPSNLKVYKSTNEKFNEEALRVVSLLKGWSPAIISGEKRPMQYSLPITFEHNPQGL